MYLNSLSFIYGVFLDDGMIGAISLSTMDFTWHDTSVLIMDEDSLEEHHQGIYSIPPL